MTESRLALSIAEAMKLSVVIPVLNEREQLPRTIAALRTALAPEEIIVVDGGSTDGTQEWLRTQSGLRILTAARGRGQQLHTGAEAATGDVLLFLHSDCLPPDNARALLTQALLNKQAAGGAFCIRFAETQPRSLKVIARGINARTRVTRTATGDQAIFVRRTVYQTLGGFAAWPLFEDVDFVTRLKRQGRFVILSSPVTISARRYIAHGPWRTTFLMYALRVGYWFGVAPEKLYAWFQDVRPHLKKV